MEHKLMRVSNTRMYGVEPVFAVCTCGWECEPTTQAEMAAAFDAHVASHGAPPAKAPWREVE